MKMFVLCLVIILAAVLKTSPDTDLDWCVPIPKNDKTPEDGFWKETQSS